MRSRVRTWTGDTGTEDTEDTLTPGENMTTRPPDTAPCYLHIYYLISTDLQKSELFIIKDLDIQIDIYTYL